MYVDGVHSLNSQLGLSNHAWLCLDLVEVLCQLAERGHAATIQAMLEYPLKHCPDVLLLGVAQIQVIFSPLPSFCLHLLFNSFSDLVMNLIQFRQCLLELQKSFCFHLFYRMCCVALINTKKMDEICFGSYNFYRTRTYLIEEMPFNLCVLFTESKLFEYIGPLYGSELNLLVLI